MSPEQALWFAETFGKLVNNVELAIMGKTHTVRLALTALLSDGHLLLEDVPGTGKTVLALEKARRLAGAGVRTLLTCFNRPLADHLACQLRGSSEIVLCPRGDIAKLEFLGGATCHEDGDVL